MIKSTFSTLIVAIVILSSCSSGRTSEVQRGGDSLRLSHAELLTIVDYDKYKVVDIADPWKKGRVLHRYVLVSDSTASHLPEGTVINVPVKRAIVFTTVHASLFADLDATDCIKGMADVSYVKRTDIRELINSKRIADVGSGMSPDVERIIDAAPDVVLVSPFENSGGYGKLDELRIPLVECADYMESSPLARAEWMRFYGMLVGKETEADSLFKRVESEYNEIKNSVKDQKSKPRVMVDIPLSNVWYVPGGKSTIGRMIADAGGNYCYADNTQGGSMAMSVESVIDKCEEADVWIFRYGGPVRTIESMAADNKAFTHVKAFKDKNLWGCSTERTTFYESTPFHPEILLKEFLFMFHPEYPVQMKFFEKLN
ncbi:MAG: ABC transporter substrate-binding protein [Prevotella sp.]